jgi:hypothetical protein
MIFVLLMAATCLRSEAVLQVGFLACAGVTERRFCKGFRPSEKKSFRRPFHADIGGLLKYDLQCAARILV